MITKEMVMEKLKTVYDPEIPINIVDLGLIYNVEINDNNINVDMTLTTPSCPMGSYVVQMAKKALKSIEDVGKVKVNIVWEPRWCPDMISKEGKRILGII